MFSFSLLFTKFFNLMLTRTVGLCERVGLNVCDSAICFFTPVSSQLQQEGAARKDVDAMCLRLGSFPHRRSAGAISSCIWLASKQNQ